MDKALAANHLPLRDNEASLSCLLSPIHLREASLLTIKGEDTALALAAIEMEVNLPATIAKLAGNDEDAVEEEEPKAWEGADKAAAGKVAEVAKGDEEKTLWEEPNWQ